MLLFLTVVITLCHLNHAATMYSKMESMPEYDAMLKDMQQKSMGHPDPEVGEMVARMNSNSRRNPEEMGTYYEGDILAAMDMTENCKTPTKNLVSRWPNAIVPFTLQETITNFAEIGVIISAMWEIEKHTCVRFVKRTDEVDYVEIGNNNTGCWAYIGRRCGKQLLNLQSDGCLHSIRTPMHEYMHTLGIFHEQTRKDRESYLRFYKDNLENQDKMHNFQLITNYDGFTTPYDYGSIMHYSLGAFAKHGKTTLEPNTRLGMLSRDAIGRHGRLTRNDIYKINHLYGCKTKRQN